MIDLTCSVVTRKQEKADATYSYVVVSISDAIREAANLNKLDRLKFRVDGRKVFIKYDPNGYQYAVGNIGINERHFPFPIEEGLALKSEFSVVGDELVVEIPETMFKIKKGFGNLVKGFNTVDTQA